MKNPMMLKPIHLVPSSASAATPLADELRKALKGDVLFSKADCGRYSTDASIYQIMPISENIERIILSHGTALEIEAQAKLDGVRTLRESGLVKVKLGMTSLEEILGCTNV